MPVIELDPGQLATARLIAALRELTCDLAGQRDRHFSPNAFADKVNGCAAELAYAKWRNLFPDISFPATPHSADAVDHGTRIDVKAVTRSDHQLIAPIWKTSEDADIYVLGVVCGNRVDFVGWAYATELICEARVTDLGHGPTYVLPQSALHRFPAVNGQEVLR